VRMAAAHWRSATLGNKALLPTMMLRVCTNITAGKFGAQLNNGPRTRRAYHPCLSTASEQTPAFRSRCSVAHKGTYLPKTCIELPSKAVSTSADQSSLPSECGASLASLYRSLIRPQIRTSRAVHDSVERSFLGKGNEQKRAYSRQEVLNDIASCYSVHKRYPMRRIYDIDDPNI